MLARIITETNAKHATIVIDPVGLKLENLRCIDEYCVIESMLSDTLDLGIDGLPKIELSHKQIINKDFIDNLITEINIAIK